MARHPGGRWRKQGELCKAGRAGSKPWRRRRRRNTAELEPRAEAGMSPVARQRTAVRWARLEAEGGKGCLSCSFGAVLLGPFT